MSKNNILVKYLIFSFIMFLNIFTLSRIFETQARFIFMPIVISALVNFLVYNVYKVVANNRKDKIFYLLSFFTGILSGVFHALGYFSGLLIIPIIIGVNLAYFILISKPILKTNLLFFIVTYIFLLIVHFIYFQFSSDSIRADLFLTILLYIGMNLIPGLLYSWYFLKVQYGEKIIFSRYLKFVIKLSALVFAYLLFMHFLFHFMNLYVPINYYVDCITYQRVCTF